MREELQLKVRAESQHDAALEVANWIFREMGFAKIIVAVPNPLHRVDHGVWRTSIIIDDLVIPVDQIDEMC